MIVPRRRFAHPDGRAARPLLPILLALLLVALAAVLLMKKSAAPDRQPLSSRPSPDKLLFDFAGLLSLHNESVETYLTTIRDRFGIEALIVTVPSLRRLGTISDAAARLMTDWKVGERFGNRGLLLLLADAEKTAKVEVSYELEDVFTDLFTAAVEELQLPAHFRQGDIGDGLVAVMEEIEARAELKHLGNYTPRTIAGLDERFASGGAGAVKRLDRTAAAGEREAPGAGILVPGSSIFTDSALLLLGKKKDPRFPAGRTPAEAFDIMRAAFSQDPASREVKLFLSMAGMPYEILQNDNRAVIYFGDKMDWKYVPFLFAKFPDGWKFDIVNQGLYVRYGPAPQWGIERGDHDYMELLNNCPYWMNLDIPWDDRDIYRVEQDSQAVSEVLKLEARYREGPDFETALELGRLGVMTARPLEKVIPCLEKARSLKPGDPAPYKYMAIAYVTYGYQYKKAIAQAEEMLKLDPRSLFARKYLGYLYHQVGDDEAAERLLKAALEVDASDCYAITTLARVYAQRYQAGRSRNDRREAVALLQKSKSACGRNPLRVVWLRNSLFRLPDPQTHFGSSFYWYNYQGQGVLAYDIQPGKPAEVAGLQEGDFVMSIDGFPVFDHYEILLILACYEPGDRVGVEIVRGALDGPLELGDVRIDPATFGLDPPRKMKLEVTLGRQEKSDQGNIPQSE